jgi:hypothetical protein
MSSFRETIEQQLAKPNPPTLYKVGQTVRIRSTLECNTRAILDILGRVGVVERITFGSIVKRVMYDVHVGGRVEPFEECELDRRYAMNMR